MAVTLTAAQMSSELGADASQTVRVARLLKVVKAKCDRYAIGAPTCTSNESAILLAGFLYEAGARARTILPSDGEGRILNISTAFRNSGAQSLLAPYRVLRAGRTEPQ